MLKPNVGWQGMDRKFSLSIDIEKIYKLAIVTPEHVCYTVNDYWFYMLQFFCHIICMHFLVCFYI